MSGTAMHGPMRVVLVGYGPVGARFVEEILPAVRAGAIDLTVIGAEPGDAYNRVLIAEYAAGRIERDALTITDTGAARTAGVRFLIGVSVTGIDRRARTVSLSSGGQTAYDRLVLATGARANVPTLDGISRPMGSDPTLPSGVTVLRSAADAERVRAAVRGHQRIVVLGAGVLGLEIALAAAIEGADVHVVFHGGYPMARNLDRGGGTVLAASLREAGVSVAAHSRAESVDFRTDEHGAARFDALLCADGKRIAGDLLLLSCGVSARTELATAADLTTTAGILVDGELQSWDDPDVYAIGDCAHVVARPDSAGPDAGAHQRPAGGPSGLIGPGWRQAAWLAASMAAEVSQAAQPAPLPQERPAVVMLKADDVDVVAAGSTGLDPWDAQPGVSVAQWADPEHGRYVKMVTAAGVLTGMVCVGMPRTGAELTLLFERGSELPADRSVLLRHDGPDDTASTASSGFDTDSTVCWCNAVTAGDIRGSINDGCCTVAEVGAATRAGTGCGGCKGRIAELIKQFSANSAAPVS